MSKRPWVLSSLKLTTPVRAQKWVPLWEISEEEVGEIGEARMLLTYGSDELRGNHWSNDELKALAEFTLFNGKRDLWPTQHRMDFWSSAGVL